MFDSYCEILIKNRSKQKHKKHLATHMHYACILLTLQQTIYILIYKGFVLYSTLYMVLYNDTKICSLPHRTIKPFSFSISWKANTVSTGNGRYLGQLEQVRGVWQ